MTEFVKAKKVLTGVFALPINKEGKFLLTQRFEPDNIQGHLKWQYAGGGIEFGEKPIQTLERECQEEIGVTPRLLYPHPFADASTWYNGETENDYHVILLTYIVSIGNQEIIPNPEETHDWKWYTLEEIQTLETLPGVKETAKLAQALVLKENLLALL